jgi:predicted  nucleic acid-binding Zn-ribbon protein
MINDKTILERNFDSLAEKNLTLENELTVAKEENIGKDQFIKRLEEEISSLQKENYQVLSKLHEIESKSSQEVSKKTTEFMKLNSFNQNFIELNEEKDNLNKEISELQSKIRHLDNEIKTKYILKSEHNAEINVLEKDNKSLNKRLKNYENNTEKLKHEYHSLRNKNNELRHSISVYERKIGDISNNALSANAGIQNIQNESNLTPLNIMFQNNEEDKDSNNKFFSTAKVITNHSIINSPKDKHNITIDEIKIDESINSQNIPTIQNNIENKVSINHNNDKLSSLKSFHSVLQNQHNYLLNELKDDSGFLEENNSQIKEFEHKISVTPTNIISQMHKNELHENIKAKLLKEIEYQENGNKRIFPTMSKLQIELPKLNTRKEKSFNNSHYKEFFYLTYQACKMNVDDIEPFLYVKHL